MGRYGSHCRLLGCLRPLRGVNMAAKCLQIFLFIALAIIAVNGEVREESDAEKTRVDFTDQLRNEVAVSEESKEKREALPEAKRNKDKKTKKKGKTSGKKNQKKKAQKKKKNKKNKAKGSKSKRKTNKKNKRKGNRSNGKGKQKKNKKKKNTKKRKNTKRKSKKNKRKGKRKGSKSNRKSKRKNKNKKGKKQKSKDKIKKKGKRVKTNRKSNGKPRQTTAKVNLTCLRDAITYTKFLKDNVINFLRRNTRLNKQNDLTNKKAAKKGEFKEPAARLIQAGGGDRSNFSCGGSTSNKGVEKLKTLTDTLDNCEIAIKDACKPPKMNETLAKECKKNAIAFNKTVSACITKATKGEDACSCFQDKEVAKEQKILRKCKGTAEAQAAAKARTACLKQIVACKNASTQAATLQYACSYSKEKLMKTLKQLTENKAAFKALLDKVKELTGLSPNMSMPRKNKGSDEETEEDSILDLQNRQRGKRQATVVECSEVTTSITTCT